MHFNTNGGFKQFCPSKCLVFWSDNLRCSALTFRFKHRLVGSRTWTGEMSLAAKHLLHFLGFDKPPASAKKKKLFRFNNKTAKYDWLVKLPNLWLFYFFMLVLELLPYRNWSAPFCAKFACRYGLGVPAALAGLLWVGLKSEDLLANASRRANRCVQKVVLEGQMACYHLVNKDMCLEIPWKWLKM